MRISTICRCPLIIRLFLIISGASWGFVRLPQTNEYFQNYLKFHPKFRKKFDQILKKFQKISKFPLKLSINCQFLIYILQEFDKVCGIGLTSAVDPPRGDPLTSPPLVELDSPEKSLSCLTLRP